MNNVRNIKKELVCGLLALASLFLALLFALAFCVGLQGRKHCYKLYK